MIRELIITIDYEKFIFVLTDNKDSEFLFKFKLEKKNLDIIFNNFIRFTTSYKFPDFKFFKDSVIRVCSNFLNRAELLLKYIIHTEVLNLSEIFLKFPKNFQIFSEKYIKILNDFQIKENVYINYKFTLIHKLKIEETKNEIDKIMKELETLIINKVNEIESKYLSENFLNNIFIEDFFQNDIIENNKKIGKIKYEFKKDSIFSLSIIYY